MLTEICAYLKNYFDRDQPKFYGKFEIVDGVVTSLNDEDMGIISGQYFRIIGSVLNDGVWRYPEEQQPYSLQDEKFEGAVWLMAVPPDLVQIAKEISEWQEKYGGIDSQAMSPYTSESFGGYSYSKGQGTIETGNGLSGWKSVFAGRLSRYKKI